MKNLAIQKTVGDPPKDFNKWMAHIVKETKRLNKKV